MDIVWPPVVVAATSLEAKAARRECAGLRVVEAGVGLCKHGGGFDTAVVSCGVAGGLHADLPTGTVVIPREVMRPDGTTLHCDPSLVDRLLRAARALGYEPIEDPIVTTLHVVTRSERVVWAERGFAGVDMETGLLQAPSVAAVRVLLDTPLRELSQEWLRPVTALLKPWNWPQAFWLARHAPACARMAARIAAAACR